MKESVRVRSDLRTAESRGLENVGTDLISMREGIGLALCSDRDSAFLAKRLSIVRKKTQHVVGTET